MPVPVLNVAEMRAWEDASWKAGCSEAAVIERVGRCVAQRIRRLTRPRDGVLLLAGRGHNGDDVRAAEPHLEPRAVELLNVHDPATALPALEAALGRQPSFIVDGLFGIGLNRPLGPDWITFVERVNASGVPVLAVDVPSGLDADCGQPLGAAIRAAHTLTVGAPKTGLLRPNAWEFTGRLEVESDIGLVPCSITGDLWWSLPEDFADFPPPRPVAAHKGSFGHLLILAGARGYHGAAVLASRAAQRARPGLVTLGTSPGVYEPVAAQLQAVMVDDWRTALGKLAGVTALLAGPGLAGGEVEAAWREHVVALWQEAPMPMVLDASALDWLPAREQAAPAVRVITPHPGEAARLLQVTTREVQEDRVGALRQLAARYRGSHVVLKGYQTLVGTAAGPVFVNGSGDSGLGQGGSGDVLAGFLAGCLAQPAWQAEPLAAVRYAVWQHGAVADQLSQRRAHWTPEDLVDRLGNLRSRRPGLRFDATSSP